MCEIYGFCGSVPTRLNVYTNEFWLHSRVHQDGFGYYLQDKNDFYVNPKSAMTCISDLRKKDFTSKLALFHIRFKTHGPASAENCHPFIKKDIHGVEWSLIHNGFIEDTHYTDALCTLQNGETDSERILLSIVEAVNGVYEHAWIDDESEMRCFVYTIIEQTIDRYGQSYDRDDIELAGEVEQQHQPLLRFVEQQLLAEQILTGIACDAQLREHDYLDAFALSLGNETFYLLDIVFHISNFHNRHSGSHLNQSVFHIFYIFIRRY